MRSCRHQNGNEMHLELWRHRCSAEKRMDVLLLERLRYRVYVHRHRWRIHGEFAEVFAKKTLHYSAVYRLSSSSWHEHIFGCTDLYRLQITLLRQKVEVALKDLLVQRRLSLALHNFSVFSTYRCTKRTLNTGGIFKKFQARVRL